jgi:hypothetical protein
LQSVSFAQPHVADAAMHTGVVASVTHALSLRDEQTAHCPASVVPAGWHAGSAAVGHGRGPGFVAE